MILIAGATGLLGTDICRRLGLLNKPTRALVRATSDPLKLESLRKLGVELAEGNLTHRGSLDAACKGARAVISTASATISRQAGDSLQKVDLEGQISLIEAAKSAGVQQFIYVSARRCEQLEFPLQSYKQQVEEHLKQSGITWTALQPSFFMETALSPILGFDYEAGRATIYGTGRNEVSYVSYHDVAAFAVAALDHPKARNAVLPIGGPRPVSQLRAVRVFEGMAGLTFARTYVSEEDLRARLESARDAMEKSFAGLVLFYALGDAFSTVQLAEEFGITLTGVRDYARRIMGWRAQSTGVPE